MNNHVNGAIMLGLMLSALRVAKTAYGNELFTQYVLALLRCSGKGGHSNVNRNTVHMYKVPDTPPQ